MKIPSRSRDALWSVLLVLLLASAAVFSPASATSAETSPPPVAEAASAHADGAPFDMTDPVRIATGKKRFNVNCGAYCHGFEGSGGKTPPFRGNKDFNVQRALKVITEGRRGSDVMPPWGKAFTQEEIWELVAYLQYLSIQPPAP